MTSFAFIIGVIPLAVAAGAGAEMRRSLGIAVFSGMLGVTLFGIFLTPVFFSVIQGLARDAAVGDRGRPVDRLHAALGTGWAVDRLLARAAWRDPPCPGRWRSCGSAGCLAALAVLGLHQMIRYRSSANPRALSSRVDSGAPGGDHQP